MMHNPKQITPVLSNWKSSGKRRGSRAFTFSLFHLVAPQCLHAPSGSVTLHGSDEQRAFKEKRKTGRCDYATLHVRNAFAHNAFSRLLARRDSVAVRQQRLLFRTCRARIIRFSVMKLLPALCRSVSKKHRFCDSNVVNLVYLPL